MKRKFWQLRLINSQSYRFSKTAAWFNFFFHSSGNWSIITVRIFFSSANDHRALERRHHMIILILFGAFQFECWRGKVTDSPSWKLSCGGGDCRAASSFPQQWQPKVKKSSTTYCEVSFTFFYFLAALNFTFRKLIPFDHEHGMDGLPKSKFEMRLVL